MLGEVRQLSADYRQGRIEPFRDLIQFLLSRTILARNDPGPRLYYPRGRRDRADLAGQGQPQNPLPLRDGRFLKIGIGLFTESTDKGNRVKASNSAVQYQTDSDPDTKNWIFRYDYIREPSKAYEGSKPYPFPTAHLQVNANLVAANVALPKGALLHIHFPTRRMPFEGVIRLLAEPDQFGVPTNAPPEVWRPLLAASEAEFLQIAHEAPLGPS